MNQTNNRIREEIQKDLDDGKFYSICSNETTFKNYVFELLKLQEQKWREELIEKIEKMSGINIENNDGTITCLILKEKVLSLIKEQ